jgi:hypothetical protein
VTEDDRVILHWADKPDLVLTGEEASAFLARVEGLDDRAAQLEVAKFFGEHGHEDE